MRRMLDPKEAGGSLPSTIKFDQEGNRTVGKNLGVDGKLKLKSLVSESNPDGDITKELGGGGTELLALKSASKRITYSKSSYDVGEIAQVSFTIPGASGKVLVSYILDYPLSYNNNGTAIFIPIIYTEDGGLSFTVDMYCIKAGTANSTSSLATIKAYYINPN